MSKTTEKTLCDCCEKKGGSGYFVRMYPKRYSFKNYKKWTWEVRTNNGNFTSGNFILKSKTACRKIAKRFAEAAGFEFREVE